MDIISRDYILHPVSSDLPRGQPRPQTVRLLCYAFRQVLGKLVFILSRYLTHCVFTLTGGGIGLSCSTWWRCLGWWEWRTKPEDEEGRTQGCGKKSLEKVKKKIADRAGLSSKNFVEVTASCHRMKNLTSQYRKWEHCCCSCLKTPSQGRLQYLPCFLHTNTIFSFISRRFADISLHLDIHLLYKKIHSTIYHRTQSPLTK